MLQKDLAEQMGISMQQVCNVELGYSNLAPGYANKFSKVIKVPQANLFLIKMMEDLLLDLYSKVKNHVKPFDEEIAVLCGIISANYIVVKASIPNTPTFVSSLEIVKLSIEVVDAMHIIFPKCANKFWHTLKDKALNLEDLKAFTCFACNDFNNTSGSVDMPTGSDGPVR